MTAEQLKQIIRDEINWTSDDSLDDAVTQWWDHYASKFSSDTDYDRIYSYARWRGLQMLVGKLRKLVNTMTGKDRVDANQQFKNAQAMMAEAWAEVLRVHPGADPNHGPATVTSGEMLNGDWEGSSDLQTDYAYRVNPASDSGSFLELDR
jgi:hypothetical protein